MKGVQICTMVLSLGWIAGTEVHAQAVSLRVETVAGVHRATFGTARGAILVHISSDAAPGDAISGRILVEPAGATPQDRNANLTDLNGWTVEWQDQRTPVSAGRYEWLIPPALRSGSATLVLSDRNGQRVAEASIPVDPVPAPTVRRAVSPVPAVNLPADGQIGMTSVVRAPSDGTLGRSVTVGPTVVEPLASSPRQFAFLVPAVPVGPAPLRITSKDQAVEGTFRVLDVGLSASNTQLVRGQRATLTVTVRGLSGITAPMTLTMVNRSPDAVRVDDIQRPLTITPQQVRRDGTFVVTRRMTGIQPGPFRIVASVGKPPSAQFDVARSTAGTLIAWQARTGVGISTAAGELVQRSVLDARFDEFLSSQQANQGDVQEVFAALLSHYCFDLRDDGLSRRRAGEGRFGASITLAALGQSRQPEATITEREVRRLSFSDFVSRLTERFTARQAVGYLFVRSVTPQAPITIDRQRNGELTDRRFVTPVGDHEIVVTGSKACRQRVTVNAFQTAVVECGA